jgi:hypothetical protein
VGGQTFDYRAVQKLVNFGRGFAGQLVGQPFVLYRLNVNSNGAAIQDFNVVNPDLRAKVTHRRVMVQVENEYMHANPFEFLCSSDDVEIGDYLKDADTVYGDGGVYAVASKRPLKQVVTLRTESLAYIYRANSSLNESVRVNSSGYYSGRAQHQDLPYVCRNGVWQLGQLGDAADPLYVGLQTTGQNKSMKAPKLPMDNLTAYWYIYVPAANGLSLVRENDYVVIPAVNDANPAMRLRVTLAYRSNSGLQGTFALCEDTMP